MSYKLKYCFIDTETTSVDTRDAGMWQVAGVIPYKGTHEEFNIKCDIFAEDGVDKGVMLMHDLKREDLKEFGRPMHAHQELVDILSRHVNRYDPKDKFHFVGYGAEFDAKVLRRWFENNNDQYFGSWFWHPWICVMGMAAFKLRKKRSEIENFKLGTVAQYMGIEVDKDKTHDALYDIQLTMKLYDKIRKMK